MTGGKKKPAVSEAGPCGDLTKDAKDNIALSAMFRNDPADYRECPNDPGTTIRARWTLRAFQGDPLDRDYALRAGASLARLAERIYPRSGDL